MQRSGSRHLLVQLRKFRQVSAPYLGAKMMRHRQDSDQQVAVSSIYVLALSMRIHRIESAEVYDSPLLMRIHNLVAVTVVMVAMTLLELHVLEYTENVGSPASISEST